MIEKEYKTMFDAENNYWWYRGLHDLIKKTIDKHGNNLKILDAGCGTCRMMQILAKNHIIEGFDLSETAIKFCHKRNIKNIWEQDINEWQAVKKYDVIISLDVICSIGIDDEIKILKNFYKGLKKDGLLILNLPAFEKLRRNHDKAVAIRKRYTKKDVREMLTKAGFNDIYVNYRLPWLYFIILLKKYFEKIIGNNQAKSDLKTLPNALNSFFYLLNKTDNFFILNKIKQCFGSSVFATAIKR